MIEAEMTEAEMTEAEMGNEGRDDDLVRAA